ncbi:hypothetical protein IWQ61_010323, partial [Dispira simplex]
MAQVDGENGEEEEVECPTLLWDRGLYDGEYVQIRDYLTLGNPGKDLLEKVQKRIKASAKKYLVHGGLLTIQYEELLKPTVTPTLFHKWGIDLVEMGELVRGERYLVIACDDLSGWVEARALKT